MVHPRSKASKTYDMEFWYLFLFRFGSGIQNGLGYGKYSRIRTFCSVLLMGVLLWADFIFIESLGYGWQCPVTLILTGISQAGVWGVEDSFDKNYDLFPSDIHLWEMLATGGILLAWFIAGGNLYLIGASIYPSLLLHKAAINIIPRIKELGWTSAFNSFFDHRTDDATGKTFTIPLLNLSIPRLSLRARIILAILSVVGAIVIHFTHRRWDIHSLLQSISL